MKHGYLSQYFDGVAAKRLSEVEANIFKSNQHEFNGVKELKLILGEPNGKIFYQAKIMYLNDHKDEPIIENSILTWYDARQKARNERGIMRWEYRLYFKDTYATQNAIAGDLLVIAKAHDGSLIIIVAENKSSIAKQIEWLFGFSNFEDLGFTVKSELEIEKNRIEFTSRLILENIGIIVEVSAEEYLDIMLHKFNKQFPSTRSFSEFARSTLNNKDIDPLNDPDSVLMAWMEREEALFRTLERYLIADQLSKGFLNSTSSGVDVDKFISFSLTVQNRRKSRAGHALENHLEELFLKNNINYSRGAMTEKKSKPDFLFPGGKQYHDPNFDLLNLTMLGVKSTCKDRWRQILVEADKITKKHLLTLEPSISVYQTDEMKIQNVQLISPEKLHQTFDFAQQGWLINIKEFIALVRFRQKCSKIAN